MATGIAIIIYFMGILVTGRMIIDGNMPSANPQPGTPDSKSSNISPSRALIWPVFWIKTIPVFMNLSKEEKKK